jgi:hypothetical protein
MDHGANERDPRSGATGPGPNRRATGIAVGITLAAVLVATIVGWIVVPDQGLVTVLGLIAALTLAAAIALPRWSERVWPILVFAFVAIGVVLIGRGGAGRPYGIIAILLAIAVFPMFVVAALRHLAAWASDGPTPTPPPARTVVGSLVSGAMLATTVLGFLGIGAQTDGQYVVRHGQPVTVTLGSRCTMSQDTSNVVTFTCPESHWTIDGRTYRGTAHIGTTTPDTDADAGQSGPGADRPAGSSPGFGNRTVEAYAMPGDDDAYTENYAANGFEGLHVFYPVPWWLILATPLLVVALIVRAVIRRIRRGAAPTAG